MSVLLESGHQTTYPLNHARIMWDNVITGATATGAQSNSPAAAVLTKTTYERWSPAVSGDSITLTFPRQYINCIALAAHSNLNPTVEVRVFDEWQTVTAYHPEGESLSLGFADDDYGVFEYSPDNEALMLLIERRLADAVRITTTYTGAAPTLGVVMAGTVLEMFRPFYGGHSPAMLSTDSKVQPNVSESGEWLGASLLRQGRNVQMNWDNLPAAWVRKHWQPFSVGLKTNPFVVAWNPLGASSDAIYCSSSDQPQPSNSGTRDLQSVSLAARGYSDGTDPVVEPLKSVDLLDLVTFARASTATYYDAQGVLRTAAIDEPRLTHDPETGESLGLLIEEQRTNLLLWSEDLTQSAWQKSANLVVTANAGQAPDGQLTADKIGITGASNRDLSQSVAVVDGQQYTYSFFMKRLSGDSLVTTSIGQINPSSEWQVFTGTITASSTSQSLIIRINDNDGSEFLFWGAQLEAASFPTSYIKTEASQVTRSADNASVDTLVPWFNANELTLLASYDGSASNNVLSMTSGSNYLDLNSGGGGFDRVRVLGRLNGAFIENTFLSQSLNPGRHKIAISVENTGYKAAIDGVLAIERETDLTGILRLATSILVGRDQQNSFRLNGPVNIIKAIPRALSAEELEIITAPEAN